MTKQHVNKVITANGPVEPAALGRVLMHEHLHADIYDWERNELIQEERPISAAYRELLEREAYPHLRACHAEGSHAYVDPTMPPWRAWPTFYRETTLATGMHIILCTGFYREVEGGTYWVKKPENRIWPFVQKSSVEQLSEMCIREINEGIHGTDVRAGAIKLGTSAARMGSQEIKAFRAGARAQIATGVHITTHCTQLGAESTQLALLEAEGVDLNRVAIGHTAWHLMSPLLKSCMEWMRAGAYFMPTNLFITDSEGKGEQYRPLVEAIHKIFDAGLGSRLLFGLDSGFCSESRPFSFITFGPPPPWMHMFQKVLPAFRAMGLTAAEEDHIMRLNPQRIIPVA